jgi:hypothetical protein
MKLLATSIVSFLLLLAVFPIYALEASQNIKSYGTIEHKDLSGFVYEFHSGRGYGTFLDGLCDPKNFGYTRAMHFANISDDGTLIPWGKTPISYSDSAIDWEHLEQYLTEEIQAGLIPVEGLWVTNFEEVTESGISAFLTKLGNLMTSLDSWMIWVPAWEFNQLCEIYTEHPEWSWGLGIAGSPRNWDISPDIYNSQMAMIRRVRDDLGIKNVLLGGAPDSSSIAYPYPPSEPWQGWEGDYGGRIRIEPWVQGIRQCDIIGASEYIKADFQEDESIVADILGDGWNKKIHELIDPSKPFFLWEYNVMFNSTGTSDTSPKFIEISYAQIPKNPWLKSIQWWCPFKTQEAWDSLNYWAAIYEGYTP